MPKVADGVAGKEKQILILAKPQEIEFFINTKETRAKEI
jgi:hypothetical protein